MTAIRALSGFQENSHLSDTPPLPRLKKLRNRRPLQELPISPAGALLCRREPAWRPIPSVDKENIQAIIEGFERRQRAITQEVQRITRSINHLQTIRRRLRRGVRGASRQSTVANTSPATRSNAGHRLSMPFDSDGSDSEPDLSVLGMTRRGVDMILDQPNALSYDDDDDEEALSQDQYEIEDTSAEEQMEEELEGVPLVDPATLGLKEISNLGKFTVSSHKQGNGVEELRSDDLKLYWQSDGPQPHKLTVYFVKRVGIRDIRFFVDYNEDESYTPTKIIFKSGTSENNLIEFAAMNLESPVGWQQVPIAGAGGDPDGNTLVSYVLQMQILENHQNGKDTHLRGIKMYAFDADTVQGADDASNRVEDAADPAENVENHTAGDVARLNDMAQALASARLEGGDAGFTVADFMRESEIR